MVSDGQVRLMRQKRMEGKTQAGAAACAGMSERTARTWKEGALPSARAGRRWRTRVDPFAEVWEAKLVPWLEADGEGVLEAKTLLERLIDEHPGVFARGQLRTLQRRVHQWRALYGPEREVYFPQEHPPGREAAIDFTHGDALGVTIQGERLRHLLFEFVLSHSGWRWVAVAFGETFETLVECVQGALWELGAAPQVLRSDNLSAATHELRAGGRSLTRRFREVLEHYGMRSTRIRPGEGHENGIVEQAHYRLKCAIAQALVLRGSRDFSDVGAYEQWVRGVVEHSHNRHLTEALGRERVFLRPLPTERGAELHDGVANGAALEHDPGERADVFGPLAADRGAGGGAAPREHGRGLLPGATGGDDAAAARRPHGTDRLPPRHLVAGAQARGLCALPLPRRALPPAGLPSGVRCAAAVVRRASRRRVREDSAPGGEYA